MKSYKILTILMAVFTATLALNLTACDDEENVKTNAVLLEAFGPSPALRGSKITFIGQNLNKVTKVILPDNIEITDIELINDGEIKVVIPQNAEVGYVKLIAGDVTLTSRSMLSYTEPISISKISPSPVKAGQTLMIEGDYLNLIQKVVFSENVEVKCQQFTTWERAKIELVVPAEAQSGIIILADTAAIPLELESETELQVVLPAVSAVSDLTGKKPGDVITIPGNDLDLVTAIELPNGASVPFEIKNNAIVFTLPEGVTDGAIVMIPASGVRVAIANIGIAVPAELIAQPAAGLRAGDELTVKGINMELVTTVKFPGVTEAVNTNSKTATEIKVTVPAKATSGDLVLNTASGKTASVAIATLKPDITAYNPASVAAGSDVELQGHNLDLVSSVTFGGDKTVDVTPAAADKLTVTVPVDAESGAVVLTMANGETITSPSLNITKPVFSYIPILPGKDTEINAGTVLSINIENGDKLNNVQVNGANTQYILQGSTLFVLIPANAGGSTKLKLISSNGEVEYTISVIGSGTTETVIMNELRDLGNWAGENNGGAFRLYKESFTDVPAGSVLKFYLTVPAAGQMQINDAGWGQWDAIFEFNDLSQTTFELELTQAFLNKILTTDDGWSTTAVIIQGSNLIISKVSVITKGGGSSNESIWTGSQDMGNWSGYIQLSADKFASTKAGDVIQVKATVSDDAQGSLKNGSTWSQIADGTEYFTITGDFELTVTSDILTQLKADGLIIGGKNYVATEVTIVHN